MDSFNKDDGGKLRWSLLPFELMEDVIKVLMNGAKKYGDDNWKKCDDTKRYVDALMRHVTAYTKGQKNDTGKGGDGLPHLAHAICNCLFLMHFDKEIPHDKRTAKDIGYFEYTVNQLIEERNALQKKLENLQKKEKKQTKCLVCDGTGIRTSPFTAIKTVCHACKGKGIRHQ